MALDVLSIESIEATECLKSWLGKGSAVAFADDDLDISGELPWAGYDLDLRLWLYVCN